MGQRSGSDLLNGAEMMDRAEILAGFSEESSALTRTYLTDQHRLAGRQLVEWMRLAGMEAGVDAVGSVVGRYEAELSNQPALLIGSHFDSDQLRLVDRQGITLAQALSDYSLDPAAWHTAARSSQQVLGYVELWSESPTSAKESIS